MSANEGAPTRRSLLSGAAAAAAGLGLLATGAAWSASLSPLVLYQPPSRRKIGYPRRFSQGVTFLPDDRVFLFRDGGRFRALSAVCPHLGCTVNRIEGAFRCPCHSSTFDAEGNRTGGPTPRGLVWRSLARAPDGNLVVDLEAEVPADHAYEMEDAG